MRRETRKCCRVRRRRADAVFIGIETPNEESLRESKKRQNLKKNLLEEIQRFIDFGMSVDCRHDRRLRQR